MLHDKRLKVKWVTFRDLLTPGQKEEWTLQQSNTVRSNEGSPIFVAGVEDLFLQDRSSLCLLAEASGDDDKGLTLREQVHKGAFPNVCIAHECHTNQTSAILTLCSFLLVNIL